MHETGDRNTQTTQTVLRRVESERDRALVDLSRVTAERDSLITKYKVCKTQKITNLLLMFCIILICLYITLHLCTQSIIYKH